MNHTIKFLITSPVMGKKVHKLSSMPGKYTLNLLCKDLGVWPQKREVSTVFRFWSFPFPYAGELIKWRQAFCWTLTTDIKENVPLGTKVTFSVHCQLWSQSHLKLPGLFLTLLSQLRSVLIYFVLSRALINWYVIPRLFACLSYWTDCKISEGNNCIYWVPHINALLNVI